MVRYKYVIDIIDGDNTIEQFTVTTAKKYILSYMKNSRTRYQCHSIHSTLLHSPAQKKKVFLDFMSTL